MKTLWWGLLLALGLLLPSLAGHAPQAVESIYSEGLFPRVAAVLGWIGERTRFSLAQTLILAGAAVLLVVLARGAAASARARAFRGFGPARRWLAAAAILVLGFHLLWGLNYERPTLYRRLSLTRVSPDPARLARLTRHLALETNQSYRQAGETGEIARPEASAPAMPEGAVPAPPGGTAPAGPSGGSPTAAPTRGRGVPAALRGSSLMIPRDEIAGRIARVYSELDPAWRRASLSWPKFPALAGWLMTRLGISGFYFPYTGEAQVDRELPDAEVPFVMAHEMAHQRGTAREDEANFLAYLVCRRSESAAARYSGALEAFGLAWNALSAAAPESARVLAPGLLDPGPKGDRAAVRAFWASHENPAMTVSNRANDLYLKTNAQTSGVASYGLAVDLLLALDAESAPAGR